MGRRKTYNRPEIAEHAMRLFWARGYHATTTRDLTDAMGVNPYSLYAEFGSKEGLYQAALARYDALVVGKHFGGLEAPRANLEEVRAVLDFFGDVDRLEGSELGCLMCNTSVERAPTVELSRASTKRFVDRLTRAFGHALGNARAAGRLVDDAPVDALARFFPTVLMGIWALSRAQVDSVVLRAAADQALARLDAVTRAAP